MTLASLLPLLTSTGCSLLFVQKPPTNHRELSDFDCTSGRGWPVTDSVFGSIFAADSVFAIASNDSSLSTGQRVAMSSIFVALTGLTAYSAYYGFRAAADCGEARSDLVARHGLPASSLSARSSAPGLVPPAAVSATSNTALLARVVKRSGEVVEGRVLGTVLLAPEQQHGTSSTLAFQVVAGSAVGAVDAAGVSLWKYPEPTIRTWIAIHEGQASFYLRDALAILANGRGGPAGTLIVAGRAKDLRPGRAVAGEVSFPSAGKVEFVNSIRVETARGIVSIPVSDLAATASSDSTLPSDTAAFAVAAPVQPAGPPNASDWATEYRGQGGLSVAVRNGATVPVFVRIRDNASQSTAAQIPVAAGGEATVHLGSGNFDVLVKVEGDGRTRYFKSRPLSVPANAAGDAVLTVGLPANGESLEEVDANEFRR